MREYPVLYNRESLPANKPKSQSTAFFAKSPSWKTEALLHSMSEKDQPSDTRPLNTQERYKRWLRRGLRLEAFKFTLYVTIPIGLMFWLLYPGNINRLVLHVRRLAHSRCSPLINLSFLV